MKNRRESLCRPLRGSRILSGPFRVIRRFNNLIHQLEHDKDQTTYNDLTAEVIWKPNS